MKKKLLEILSILIIISLVIGFLIVYQNITKNSLEIDELTVFCDFEIQNEKSEFITDNEKFILSAGTASKEIVFEGEQSLYISKNKMYKSLFVMNDLKPYSNVTISFKRYNSSNAAIVVQGTDPSIFYYKTRTVHKTLENGWDEIVLKFSCGRDFNDSLKVYIFNSENEETYIDNLELKVSKELNYPEFKSEEALLIYIEDIEYNKLQRKKNDALDKGVLITEDDSWVNALVYGNGKMMHSEIRLKGDLLDHLRGDKWSLRIKLSGDSWNGMRVFSLQSPKVRGFLNEWIIHKTCKDLDILTPKYGYVPVYINGRSVGLYCYEEHFQKELIESSKRREGVIVKFGETDFWNFMLQKVPNGFTYITSVIEPFSKGSVLKDTTKYNQFIIASNLLDMYRNMGAVASDIFDVKKMAKFIAFVNSRNAFHSLQWHNVRYYYNPVLCRIEPIAFDMFSGVNEYTFSNPLSPMLLENLKYDARQAIAYLMTDSVFEKEYFRYLNVFTNEFDYKYYKNKFHDEYRHLDSLSKLEYTCYYFDTIQFETVLEKINVFLPVFIDSLKSELYRKKVEELPKKPLSVNGMQQALRFGDKYLKCYRDAEKVLHIKSFLQFDVLILGIGDSKNINFDIKQDVLNKNSGEVKNKNITISENLDNYSHLYFKIYNTDTIFKTEIVPWPAPTTHNPRTEIAENATDISQYIDYKNHEVYFKGNIVFDNHVSTPVGYTVYFEPGTIINIVNNAAFIINSNVIMNGSKEHPITIHSSDKSANGFTVLQGEAKSILNNVVFDNLNTLNYKGWTLTGAVTFYESDVEFNNCSFTNNHCEDMINTIRCEFYLNACNIQNTFGDSHDSDFCTGTISECIFTNNGNDAIDFSNSEVVIKNCIINGAGDKGISVGENTKAQILNIEILNVNIGIAAKDLSHAEVDYCKIDDATYGFLLLQKKPEFGPASITANNCELKDVWTESLIEKRSTLILNGKTYKGKQDKLKTLFYE